LSGSSCLAEAPASAKRKFETNNSIKIIAHGFPLSRLLPIHPEKVNFYFLRIKRIKTCHSRESGNPLFFNNLLPIIMDARLHGHDSLYKYFNIFLICNSLVCGNASISSF